MPRGLALFCALVLCAGCDDDPPPLRLPPPPPPPVRVAVAAPRLIAGPGAFDLVLGDDGPVLLFGPPSAEGGGVRALTLGNQGEAVGAERVLLGEGGVARDLAPQADEIVGLAHGGRLRVAWVERDQLVFTVRSMLLDAQATSAGIPARIGPTSRTRTGRGSLALARHDGGFALLYRRDDGPCEDGGRTQCARFAVHHSGSARPGRRGGGLAIPDPCDAPVVGFASIDGTWYQAVCSLENDAPKTTVFGIQFEPQYAHAEHVLPACQPRVMGVTPEGVVLSSDCNGGAGTLVSDAGRSVRALEGVPEIECTDGSPSWRFGGIETAFRAPQAQLEGLLPSAIRSEHARAVWTGEALLIAEAVGDELSVRRFECDDGRFRRTDHEAL